ncbi:MAG: Asp-tRNA(Asn)/Glu-tRNA(Gln) amidotransferase subunit GatB [Elusimicrobiota bacterium]
MNYESVIGLEVHVQLKTESKLFCACPAEFGAEPNSQMCPVCCGHPGVLPVLNRRAVEGLVRAALALNCRINPRSIFARKQYFYPDLPKGYQISQFELPLAEGGHLDVPSEEGNRRVRIHRIHLEEDAGKLLHAIGSRALEYSLVDLNRAGVPLMEIVSEPDLRTAEEASAYLSSLRNILRYVGVSDCDMEKGSMRCDANVSLRPAGSGTLGTKAEIKNMNSFRSVRDAIAHEIERQKALLDAGGRVVQETRLWDQAKQTTQTMRSKEEAHDYRYFPEPDLVPVEIGEDLLREFRAALPELPEARARRYTGDLGLTEYDAGVLTSEKALADYFEAALAGFEGPAKKAAVKPLVNWITTELLGRLNAAKKGIGESPVPAGRLAALVKLVQGGTLSGKAAKDVFEEMFEKGGDPETIVKDKGLVQVEDPSQIAAWVEEVLAANAKIVGDVRGGNERAIGSLVGAVMKKSAGRANPQTVNRILKEKLLSKS